MGIEQVSTAREGGGGVRGPWALRRDAQQGGESGVQSMAVSLEFEL